MFVFHYETYTRIHYNTGRYSCALLARSNLGSELFCLTRGSFIYLSPCSVTYLSKCFPDCVLLIALQEFFFFVKCFMEWFLNIILKW